MFDITIYLTHTRTHTSQAAKQYSADSVQFVGVATSQIVTTQHFISVVCKFKFTETVEFSKYKFQNVSGPVFDMLSPSAFDNDF